MSARQRPVYEPRPEQLRLMPEISGNTINGLGEATRRRPSPIYWHRAERIPHGALMDQMVANFQKVPELRAAYANEAARGPRQPVPIAETREEDAPENWARRAKEFALNHEADLVGISGIDPIWVFEGYPEIEQPWVIVLGVAMDHVRLAKSDRLPEELDSALEVADQYNRGARASRALANWIRERGWFARAHTGPWAGSLTLIPPALACGFGELGKHGSIINRRYGSSFRLAGVVTDLPLIPDQPESFGADDFCASCRVCTDACPPDAIFREKQMVRGVRKWYVDFDKCIPYFNDTHGCGICIAACPWSRPGVAPRLADKLTRRAAAASTG